MKNILLFTILLVCISLSYQVEAAIVWQHSWAGCANNAAVSSCGNWSEANAWAIDSGTLYNPGAVNSQVITSSAFATGGWNWFQVNSSTMTGVVFYSDPIAEPTKVLEIGWTSSTQLYINDGAGAYSCGATRTPQNGDWYGVNVTTSPYQVWFKNTTNLINLCNSTTTRSYAWTAGNLAFNSCDAAACDSQAKRIAQVCNSQLRDDCFPSATPASIPPSINQSTHNFTSGYNSTDQVKWKTDLTYRSNTYDTTPSGKFNVTTTTYCAVSLYDLNWTAMIANGSYYNTTEGNSTSHSWAYGTSLVQGNYSFYISCAGSNISTSTSGALPVQVLTTITPSVALNSELTGGVTDILINWSRINYTVENYTSGNINYTLVESNVSYNKSFVINLTNPYTFNISINLSLSRENNTIFRYYCGGVYLTSTTKHFNNLSSLQQRLFNCTMDVNLTQAYVNYSLVVDKTDYNFNISGTGAII